MRRFITVLLLMLFVNQMIAQELNCSVTVNADKIPGSNKQIFKTLENAINEFVNQKRWTNLNYKTQERLNCNLTLTLLEQDNSEFRGHIQIQSSRPVYNSSYVTPVFNFKDDNISFQYIEFQPLIFNENTFESNLVSVLSYYVNIILGMDADTFAFNGGEQFFTNAQNIVVQAQQSGYKGWNQNDGNNTRFTLIDNILSPTYSLYREMMYVYHLKGLDILSTNQQNAKLQIANAVGMLRTIYNNRPNAFLLRIFMDSKADEIVDIFSDGPQFDSKNLKEDLIRISPLNASKWNEIE
jgi:hypothetical protein